jgi:hypothetical protein
MIGQLGRIVVITGASLLVLGLLMILIGRFAPSGRLLPGDIVIRRPGFTFYMPLATMIVLSLLMTAVAWLIAWFRR